MVGNLAAQIDAHGQDVTDAAAGCAERPREILKRAGRLLAVALAIHLAVHVPRNLARHEYEAASLIERGLGHAVGRRVVQITRVQAPNRHALAPIGSTVELIARARLPKRQPFPFKSSDRGQRRLPSTLFRVVRCSRPRARGATWIPPSVRRPWPRRSDAVRACWRRARA